MTGYRLFTAKADTSENSPYGASAMETVRLNLPEPALRPSGPLWDKAVELEATFLSEMLSHSGLDEAGGEFAGGEGGGQFASFLRDEQARMMARSGGIGLAEQLFRALNKGAGADV